VSDPSISVITAVYNARGTIGETIASVLAQTYRNVEFIIVDGGSSDGTAEILKAQQDHFDVYISEPDDGIYDALNKGIKHARGDVIGFLHADDLFADEMVLSKIARAFSDHNCGAVYGDLVYVSKDESDKVIRYWQSGAYSADKLKHGWMPPHPTFYVRRSVYEQHGGFDISFRIAADYDCMLRFLWLAKIECVYIPATLVKMRLGGASNRSVENIIRKSREDYRALHHNRVGGLWALACKNFSKLPQFFKRQG